MSENPEEQAAARNLEVLVTSGPVARITLNRPGQRNALSRAVLDELLVALDTCARRPDLRVVVLAANGPAFSAGHDLREIREASAEQIEDLFARCAQVMLRIQELPQPVIARVHGIATAAGCQLVAACDLAVAADTATFATPGINIGFFCSTPAVPVVRSVGRKRAMEMLLTGEPIDARTACAWGLVNRVAPVSEIDSVIQILVDRIVASSGTSIALGKRAFYRQIGQAEREAYEIASAVMCENALTPDAREGIAAFLEKRRPAWPTA
ncbi:MAG: enoyl-CoA hydratase [Deltaproteobacteria bacterium]|nr:enoyl-CoA hydratase [Deltaproteobacteria bacterium]